MITGKIYTTLLLFICFLGMGQTPPARTYFHDKNGNETKQVKERWNENAYGQKHNRYIKYSKKGNPTHFYTYKNGVKNGTFIEPTKGMEWFDCKTKGSYLNGKLSGEYKVYAPKSGGSMIQALNLFSGKISEADDVYVMRECFYENGKLNGQYKSYSYDTESNKVYLVNSGNYINDYPEGVWEMYGQVSGGFSSGKFKSGKMIGTWSNLSFQKIRYGKEEVTVENGEYKKGYKVIYDSEGKIQKILSSKGQDLVEPLKIQSELDQLEKKKREIIYTDLQKLKGNTSVEDFNSYFLKHGLTSHSQSIDTNFINILNMKDGDYIVSKKGIDKYSRNILMSLSKWIVLDNHYDVITKFTFKISESKFTEIAYFASPYTTVLEFDKKGLLEFKEKYNTHNGLREIKSQEVYVHDEKGKLFISQNVNSLINWDTYNNLSSDSEKLLYLKALCLAFPHKFNSTSGKYCCRISSVINLISITYDVNEEARKGALELLKKQLLNQGIGYCAIKSKYKFDKNTTKVLSEAFVLWGVGENQKALILLEDHKGSVLKYNDVIEKDVELKLGKTFILWYQEYLQGKTKYALPNEKEFLKAVKKI